VSHFNHHKHEQTKIRKLEKVNYYARPCSTLKHLENAHDEAVENMTVFRSGSIQTVENNEFDIVVRCLDEKVGELSHPPGFVLKSWGW